MKTRGILRHAAPALAAVAMLTGLSSAAGGLAATSAAATPLPALAKAAPAPVGPAVDPTAVLVATPAAVNVGVATVFDGSTSTAVAPDSWSLNYGDGSASVTGNAPIAAADLGSHAYTTAGIYTATLTVTNGAAVTSTATAAVTVNGPAPDGSCATTGTFPNVTRNCDLYAEAGGTASAGGLPIWGFTLGAAGTPTLPGPRLIATAGETLNITLHNQLAPTAPSCAPCNAGNVGLEILGVNGASPDATGAVLGATKSYSFALANPGTYIYEAAVGTPGGSRQVAMGMSGVLIVRSTQGTQVAYGNGSTLDAFNKEKVVALNELNSEFSNDPFKNSTEEYNPNYFFVDGVAYDPAKPALDPSDPAFIPTADSVRFDVANGDQVLVRYANLGLRPHSMGLINLRQTESARDSRLLVNPVDERAEWMNPGQSADTFIQIPATSTVGAQYPLYDAGFHLNNDTAGGLGGMYTSFNVTAGVGGSPSGPIVSPIQVASIDGNFPATNNGVDLTVTATLTGQAGALVTGARWYLDTVGSTPVDICTAPNTPSLGCTPLTPTSGGFGGGSASLNFAISWTTLQTMLAIPADPRPPFGDHIIWVEGQDNNVVAPATTGRWGQAAGDVVSLPVRDALISALSISPTVTNGTTTPSVVVGTPPGQVAVNGTATASLASYGIEAAEACIVPATGPAPTAADLTGPPGCKADGTNQPLTVSPGPDPTTKPPTLIANQVAIGGSVVPSATDGSYWVLVHAHEALATDTTQNRWSPWVYFDPTAPYAAQPGTYLPLFVVTSANAPTTSSLVLNPNPNSGYLDGPGNAGLFAAVQLKGTITSAVGAPIALAESFMGTSYPKGNPTPPIPLTCTAPNTPAGCLPASGAGAEMIPDNGHWSDAATKTVTAYLPLADFLAQPDGLIPVYVHGKDVAGNWGPLAEVDLTLDKTLPVVALPPSTVKTATGNISVTANDPVAGGVSTGIVAAEWFVATGADPGPGNGTAVTGIPAAATPGATITFPVATGRPAGTQISVRVKDAVGNWSTPVVVSV